MRVITGRSKGRKLKAPKSGIRPLTGRVKEALFNILSAKTEASCFLDLFAGSGAVGIEALSRGAKLAVFVEMNKKTAELIRENLRMTELSQLAEVYAIDVLRALKILDSKKQKFDIIFLGPPYDSPLLEETMTRLSEIDILNDDGVIIAEHRKKQPIAESYDYLEKFRSNVYSDTALSFYRRK